MRRFRFPITPLLGYTPLHGADARHLRCGRRSREARTIAWSGRSREARTIAWSRRSREARTGGLLTIPGSPNVRDRGHPATPTTIPPPKSKWFIFSVLGDGWRCNCGKQRGYLYSQENKALASAVRSIAWSRRSREARSGVLVGEQPETIVRPMEVIIGKTEGILS